MSQTNINRKILCFVGYNESEMKGIQIGGQSPVIISKAEFQNPMDYFLRNSNALGIAAEFVVSDMLTAIVATSILTGFDLYDSSHRPHHGDFILLNETTRICFMIEVKNKQTLNKEDDFDKFNYDMNNVATLYDAHVIGVFLQLGTTSIPKHGEIEIGDKCCYLTKNYVTLSGLAIIFKYYIDSINKMVRMNKPETIKRIDAIRISHDEKIKHLEELIRNEQKQIQQLETIKTKLITERDLIAMIVQSDSKTDQEIPSMPTLTTRIRSSNARSSNQCINDASSVQQRIRSSNVRTNDQRSSNQSISDAFSVQQRTHPSTLVSTQQRTRAQVNAQSVRGRVNVTVARQTPPLQNTTTLTHTPKLTLNRKQQTHTNAVRTNDARTNDVRTDSSTGDAIEEVDEEIENDDADNDENDIDGIDADEVNEDELFDDDDIPHIRNVRTNTNAQSCTVRRTRPSATSGEELFKELVKIKGRPSLTSLTKKYLLDMFPEHVLYINMTPIKTIIAQFRDYLNT